MSLTAELRAAAAILDVRSGDAEPPTLVRQAPARGVHGRGIAFAILIVALAVGVWFSRGELWRLWRQYATPPPDPIVAVRPLGVDDASWTYFADGLAADLITRLGQIPGFTVLGRSATREYRGADPSQIAAGLGAQVVLTGSVSRQGDDLRGTIGLVDPKDGVQIWSQRCELANFDLPRGYPAIEGSAHVRSFEGRFSATQRNASALEVLLRLIAISAHLVKRRLRFSAVFAQAFVPLDEAR